MKRLPLILIGLTLLVNSGCTANSQAYTHQTTDRSVSSPSSTSNSTSSSPSSSASSTSSSPISNGTQSAQPKPQVIEKLIYTGCTKDSDCTDGDAKYCVNVKGFSVCAKGCSDTTPCGDPTLTCAPRPSQETPGQDVSVCVKENRLRAEGEYCTSNDKCDKGLHCVTMFNRIGMEEDHGICRRLTECSSDPTCNPSKTGEQCIYILVSGESQREIRACSSCGVTLAYHCNYSKDTCIQRLDNPRKGRCVAQCADDNDCNPGEKCAKPDFTALNTRGKICVKAEETSGGDVNSKCKLSSSPAQQCPEGYYCSPDSDAEAANGTGVCRFKCTKSSDGEKSQECPERAPYCDILRYVEKTGSHITTKNEFLCSKTPLIHKPTKKVSTLDDPCALGDSWDFDNICLADSRRSHTGTLKKRCKTDGDCHTGQTCTFVDLIAYDIKNHYWLNDVGATTGYCK